MKTKITLIICLLIATTALNAQYFQWAKQMGGTSLDNGQAICVDPSGNLYTTGYFEGAADFDPGPTTTIFTSAGYEDVFVQKMDASGNFIWARSFGGVGNDQAYSINTDAAGNIYTIGTFTASGDYDPGPGTVNLICKGNRDVFIQKMDAAGNFLWARSLGDLGNDEGWSCSVDALGNVYTVGHFSGTVDFDPGPDSTKFTSAGNMDVFIQKMDAAGNFVWAKSIGGVGNEEAYAVCIDGAGNVYLTGYFASTVDFDPGPATNNITGPGNSDIYVLKLDASGNFLWARVFGGTNNEVPKAICTDNAGNVYTTGSFKATGDYDPGPGTALLGLISVEDIFVQKMDSAGNFQWARAFGGFYIDNAFSIKTDAAGNVYTMGSYNNTVDFDPGAGITNLYSEGSEDVFVQKMDAAGNFLWAQSLGGGGQDHGRSICVDAAGDIYTTGFFATVADFDPGAGTFNLTTAGLWDIFVQKMSQTPNKIDEPETDVNVAVSPNPSAGTVLVALPQATRNVVLELTDIQGKVISKQTYGTLSSTSIELTGAKGIYFLTVKTPQGQSKIKLVKE